MSTYYCVLGNTPDLSLAELRAVLASDQVNQVLPDVVAVDLENDDAARALMEKVGGTVKILRQVAEVKTADTTAEENTGIVKACTDYLSQKKEKVVFGLGELGRDHLPAIELTEIKEALRALDLPVRYISGTRHGLSAAVLLHQRQVVELIIIHQAETEIVAETIAVQDIDAWSRRDRGKPYANRKKGMLPPKVARMMVNLGLAASTDPTWLYDPFCGSGTVLMEGWLRGVSVVGSDIDPEAVSGSQRNLEWLATEWADHAPEALPTPAQLSVLLADATHVKPEQLPGKISLIVTEPFLGKPTPQHKQLPNIIKGLDKLYWGCFRHWQHLLADQAVVVLILPEFYPDSAAGTFASLIDKLASLGYTMVSNPIKYHRPQAIIQRRICIWKYTYVTR